MSNAPDNVTALPKPEKPTALPVTVDVNNPTSLYLDTAVFNQIQRVALMMTRSGLAPAHLRSDKENDRTADCILVVAQALRWRSDPFAVAQHTFVTQGKLGYEGKLIAAMVNASGNLREPLNYEYDGEGDNRRVVVSGQFRGSDVVRKVEGKVSSWKTANKFWKDNPDQMLAYRGAREWARRHMPEVLLGVNSEDEVAPRTMVDVTPTGSAAALNDALSRVAPQPATDDLRVVDGSVLDSAPRDVPVMGITPTSEEAALVAEGDAAETSATLRAKLIEGLADMPTKHDLDEYVKEIEASLATLSETDRGLFSAAKYKREKALVRK